MINLSRKHNNKYSNFSWGDLFSSNYYPACSGLTYEKDSCQKATYECKAKQGLHWSKDGGKECWMEQYNRILGEKLPQAPVEEVQEPKMKLSKDAIIGISVGVISLFVIIGVTIKRNI